MASEKVVLKQGQSLVRASSAWQQEGEGFGNRSLKTGVVFGEENVHEDIIMLVSWYFKPSQPQRTIKGPTRERLQHKKKS